MKDQTQHIFVHEGLHCTLYLTNTLFVKNTTVFNNSLKPERLRNKNNTTTNSGGRERLAGAWLKAILASILAKGHSAERNNCGGESLLSVQRGKKIKTNQQNLCKNRNQQTRASFRGSSERKAAWLQIRMESHQSDMQIFTFYGEGEIRKGV